MARLRRDYAEFTARDAEIIAIGPEGPRTFRRYWHINDMPFTGVPDPTHQVANLFRQKVNLLKLGRMPAMLIIDKQGRLVYQHYGESMSDIPENDVVLAVLDRLNEPDE